MKQLTFDTVNQTRTRCQARWPGIAVREVEAKTLLSRTGIPGGDYCLNPYVGCVHACRYCYATFMKRFTGHQETWGRFVDIKVNAAAALARQLRRTTPGKVIVGSVTDAYQPVEAEYGLTRRCLELLADAGFVLRILTKSPLALRDLDLFARCADVEVGVTVTTDDERMREKFEPGAPPIAARVETLKRLHHAGVSTYAFVGPVLPMNPETVAAQVGPWADRVLIDRMNYAGKTTALYRKLGLQKWLDRRFVGDVVDRLEKAFGRRRTERC